MKIVENTPAYDFNAITAERITFVMSRLRGKKILLSFLRNGSCALSLYRLHQQKKYSEAFLKKGLEVVCVFESLPKDILPYTGRMEAPFTILADPFGLLYDMYHVKNEEEKIKSMMHNGLLESAISLASSAGFAWVPQEKSNFFRMPADFLVDEHFIIRKVHHATTITDLMPAINILAWLSNPSIRQLNYNNMHASLAGIPTLGDAA